MVSRVESKAKEEQHRDGSAGHTSSSSWKRFVRAVGPFWRSDWALLLRATLLMAVAIVLQIWIPLQCSKIAALPAKKISTGGGVPSSDDSAESHHVLPAFTGVELVQKTFLVIVLLLTQHATSCYGHYLSGVCGSQVGQRVLRASMHKLVELPWEEAVRVPPAARVQELYQGAKLSSEVTERVLTNIFNSFVTGLCYTGAVLYISAPMTGVLVLIALTAQLFERWFRARFTDAALQKARDEQLAAIEADASSYMVSALQRAAVIRVFKLSSYVTYRFQQKSEDVLERQSENAWDIHSRSAISNSVTNSLFITTIGVSAYLQQHGILDVGDIVAFFFSMSQLVSNWNTLYNELVKLVSLSTRAVALVDLLLWESEHEANGKKGEHGEVHYADKDLALGGHIVELENIRVFYRDAQLSSLHNINLRCDVGGFVALVGRSGSGKTTLLRLLAGLVLPARGGRVRIAVHANTVALLEQTPTLLPGSIRDNIKFGHFSATDEEMIRAAKASGCHEFITALKNGYDNEVSNIDCAQLSGGQLQRICLARVLVSRAQVLLLDEPTTGLDRVNTRLFMDSILSLKSEGRTIFFVTHQLDLVQHADRVLGVQEGNICFDGGYPEALEHFHGQSDLDAS